MTSHQGACNGKGGCARAEPRNAAPLHTIEISKALQLRWSAGIDAYRGGDGSLPFKGDPIEEMYLEALDLELYAREAMRQRVVPLAMLRDIERHVRSVTVVLQRHLLSRDAGGTLPVDHPALRLRNMASTMAKAEEGRR